MMKIDQIAYYHINDRAERELKRDLGLLDAPWQKDTVVANSIVYDRNGNGLSCVNEADLQFNYDLGIELELIRYTRGHHWHKHEHALNADIWLSHVGAHVEDDFPPMGGARLVQETWTRSHSGAFFAPGAPGHGRTYHYRIYELAPRTYFKLIKRINP